MEITKKKIKNINLVHKKSIDFNSKLQIKKIIDLTKNDKLLKDTL